MTRIPVDTLSCEFDDTWIVARWDDSSWYRAHIQKLSGDLDGRPEGTKAVDLIGIKDNLAYLIEVKDFRGFAIESKQRQTAALPLELGLKARDTIAGLFGLVSRGNPPEIVDAWCQKASAGPAVRVLAWLAEDALRPAEAARDRNRRNMIRSDVIHQKLAWLTTQVLVRDPLRGDAGVAGVTVSGIHPSRR